LSDTTRLTRVSRTLEQDNRLLAERNRELEQVIARLSEEEAAHERERLCRMAHDAWSQQLAIAGLTVDMLIRQNDVPVDAAKLAECGVLLAMPGAEELTQLPGDLDKAVSRLAHSYRQLGVTTIVTGQAQFTPAQEDILKPVLREAFSNAVRHAYARTIEIRYFSDNKKAGIEIRNDTLDSSPDIAEGRGLHDIRVRVSQAGGSIKVSKKTRFSLTVTFDRTTEEDDDENCPD
jgi:signal transduction histidine kinase